MKNVAGVLPFVILSVYFTLGNMTGFRLPAMRAPAVAGLVLMAFALYLRKRVSGLSAIDRGFLIFMALSAAAFLVFPRGPAEVIAEFNIGLFYLVLFAVTALPALISKRYFTVYFARKTTPEAVWETDIFKTINRHLTWAWAAIFAISAFVTVIPALFFPAGGTLTGLLFQVVLPTLLMVGIGIPMNRIYPRHYQKKLGLDPPDTAEGGPSGGSALTEQATNKPHQEEKMSQFRVVAINGSPHGAIGNTSQMIRMIGEGLSREGITLEEIFLTEKAIAYCVGCAVCLEKGKCWHRDDHAGITDALFAADGIILASPVYFKHVTAQMKTFIDRSLTFGHKPRAASKPGLAVTVSTGLADTATARYLEDMVRVYGAFSLGALVAIGTGPGGFLGKEAVETRAQDLARDLARAIKEKKRYPVTGDDLYAYLFMRDLVTREKEFMRDDFQYWQDAGILDGFEAHVQQRYARGSFDPEMRKEWIRGLIKEESAAKTGVIGISNMPPAGSTGPAATISCHELLERMPLGFRSEAAPGLNAVYQFEISGSETFNAYFKIADDRCTFHEGSHEKPDVLIKAPAEVWLAVSQGALDGQSAFMSGKYRVEGNVGLLMKLKTLFPA
jgi:multimeric flavodoxin WrbA/putative sterol carrier protein